MPFKSYRQLVNILAAALLCGVSSAQAADTVRVAAAAINIAHGPIALAAAEPSIFADQGLALELTDLRGQSPNCIAALLSKAADLCQVGTTTGTDAIAEGADLVAVAAITGPNAEVILSSASAAKLGVAADAPVAERIRALKGLNLVTSAPGSAIYTLTDAMLQTEDMSIADVKYRTLAEVPAMIEAIRNEQIDGAVWVIGSLAQLLVKGKGVRWISLARGDVEAYGGLPFVTVFARRDWAEANPELVSRIHAAYAEAVRRLKEDPETSSRLIKDKYFPDMAQALWDDGYAQAREAFLSGAKTDAKAWGRFLELQATSSHKDYGPAAFDRVVVGAAKAN